jgi:electron transfer flavoprotein beta subunit
VNVLVCVKRVPETGARISLTADAQAVDDSFLGHTISPHEECAVEEALRIAAAHGGSTTVLTLGPPAAAEQLRDAIAMGIDAAILLETDGSDCDPQATAAAIAEAVRERDFDLLLFGNESADSGGYQVGIRVAYLLGLPVVTGAKGIELANGVATVRREAGAGWEIFEAPLPAVVTVREGINLPRYPSLPGRLKAKKTELQTSAPVLRGGGLGKVRLSVPQDESAPVVVLGEGAAAAPRVVDVLRELGVA